MPGTRKKQLPASQLIEDLISHLDGDRISAGDLLGKLEGRGLGLVLLILSLPMCIPNIPGISTLFGLLLIGPSLQMIFRSKALWMPGFVKRWSFKGKDLRKALGACAGLMRRIEYLARPRLTGLTQGIFLTYAGLQTLLMALVLLLPMPGANIIPGFAVALTGLAVLQRDGVFMLLSIPVAAGACAWVYFGFKYVIEFILTAYRSGLTIFNDITQSLQGFGLPELPL